SFICFCSAAAPTTEVYTLSLHDALPIFQAEHHRGGELGVHHQVAAVADHHHHLALRRSQLHAQAAGDLVAHARVAVLEVVAVARSEEHTSELQSRENLVCRLLLEKKKKK